MKNVVPRTVVSYGKLAGRFTSATSLDGKAEWQSRSSCDPCPLQLKTTRLRLWV